MDKQERNLWLDTLRGFSAIWVVLFHLNVIVPEQNNLYYQFVQLGYLGVPIFFIISGYCIQITAQRSSSIMIFYWRRFCRIYPPYLVSVLVVLFVILIVKITTGVNDVATMPQDWKEWLATLTIMTAPATKVLTMNWAYWSLTYEVCFYLVMGLTLINKRLRFTIIYVVTGLSFIPGLYKEMGLFFLARWCLFILGVGLYELIENYKFHGKLLIILSGVGMFIHTIYLEKNPLVYADPSYTSVKIASIITAISIILSFKVKHWLTQENLLSKIGEISYSLYLLHVPIGCYLIVRYRQGIWFDSLPLHILYDMMVLGICLVISLIFFNIIEKPTIRLGKNLKVFEFITFPSKLPKR